MASKPAPMVEPEWQIERMEGMVSFFNFTRRNALLAGASILALAGGKVHAAKDTRPNIVFIMADDLGYADLSCYGRQEYQTPNIDILARDGMRFTRAYANSAVCSSTRTGLITGRYQYRVTVGLDEPNGANDVSLPEGLPTMPSVLKQAGYHTALIGKWHLGRMPEHSPVKSGYEHFYGFPEGASDYYRHDKNLWNDDQLAHQEGYLTDLLGDNAVLTIEKFAKAGKPFLISLHFNAPHWPWESGDENGKMESDRVATSPGGIISFDSGSMKTYAAMVTRMDFQVGRVLDALKATGQADNTIVVFTSDNGGERFADTWPFSGKKTELLEGGLRIPAIVRWPGHVPAGSLNDQAIMSMDWMPTFASIAGAKPSAKYPSDGMDLSATLTKAAAPVPRKLFWRYNNKSQEAALDGDWKYVKILGNTFLFNVVDDPMERANMKVRRKDIYDRLVADWQAWNATMLPYAPNNISSGFSGEELADHFGIPPNPGRNRGPVTR